MRPPLTTARQLPTGRITIMEGAKLLVSILLTDGKKTWMADTSWVQILLAVAARCCLLVRT